MPYLEREEAKIKPFDKIINVMILGAKNTGRHFFETSQDPDNRPGFDFKVKEIKTKSQKLKFKIWIRELDSKDKFDAIYRSKLHPSNFYTFQVYY